MYVAFPLTNCSSPLLSSNSILSTHSTWFHLLATFCLIQAICEDWCKKSTDCFVEVDNSTLKLNNSTGIWDQSRGTVCTNRLILGFSSQGGMNDGGRSLRRR